MWWIQTRELADADGQPTGHWRLTAKSDEDGGGPYALCDCIVNGVNGHLTPEDAANCAEAKAEAEKF